MGAGAINDHSLRERFHSGGPAARHARVMLERYHLLLGEVFPIEGEIETVDAYAEYLCDPSLEWDIVVLTDASNARIVGGIQWQAIRNVGASWIDALAWVEHVWLVDDPAVRNYDSFRNLLITARKHMHQRGVNVGFMEFNDPEKMTPEQMAQDAAGGLSSLNRLRLWAWLGLSEPVYSTPDGRRRPAPYAQPSMAGGPPVPLLSLGFFAFAQDLGRVHVLATDYLRILYRAHSTIRGVDPATDPTCLEYTAAVRALPVTEFDFVPLKERFS